MNESDFYDKCYDAWRSGRNPDMVSRDRYDYLMCSGFVEDEISWRDCYPNRGRSEQEEPDYYLLEGAKNTEQQLQYE